MAGARVAAWAAPGVAVTARIMFQGPGLVCQDCRVEIGMHHKPGCPDAGHTERQTAPTEGEAALLIKLFDECARLEAYEGALRGEGSKDIFRTTAATQLLWTQVRLVASTYRALVASGALPKVEGPPATPLPMTEGLTPPEFQHQKEARPALAGVTALEYVDPDEAQAEARLGGRQVDCGALKAAAATIAAHRHLLIASCVDISAGADRYDGADDVMGVSPQRHATDALHDVVAAIEHVVDDDFRSRETRGGS